MKRQVRFHIGGRLVTSGGIFFNCLVDDRNQLLGHRRIQRQNGSRPGIDDRVEIRKKAEIEEEAPRGFWKKLKNVFAAKEEKFVTKIVKRDAIKTGPYLDQ